jgi:uncharacterized protein
MNKIVILWAAILLSSTITAQENKDQIINVSTNIAHRLVNRSFDSIVAYFDSSIVKELPAEKLEQSIDGLIGINGELVDAGEPVLENTGGNTLTRTKMVFAKTSMLLTITFTSNGLVKGLFLSNFNGFYTIPTYVKSLSFLESKHEFGKKGWEIEGTLSYPRDEKKHPLVIIVHGSGPMDRDGSTGGSKIYRDLAWGLATQGYCVFRYDKRSNVHGGKLFMEAYKGNSYTPYDEVEEDVLLAIHLMKQNRHVDSTRIVLVGHSQGGMLLPKIVQQVSVKGIVLMAANARPIQDMLIEQMNYLYPDGGNMTLNQYNEKLNIIRQANFAKKKKLPQDTPIDSLPFGVRASYWNYLNAYDQVKTFRKLKLPILILQGERDYQVTMTDFQLWEKAAKKRKGQTLFVSYPKLNHLFFKGEGLSSPSEYMLPASLDIKVVTDISEWIQGLH